MTPTPERPWLVAGIGGTNARFGLVESPESAPRCVHVMACRDHAGLAGAAARLASLELV